MRKSTLVRIFFGGAIAMAMFMALLTGGISLENSFLLLSSLVFLIEAALIVRLPRLAIPFWALIVVSGISLISYEVIDTSALSDAASRGLGVILLFWMLIIWLVYVVGLMVLVAQRKLFAEAEYRGKLYELRAIVAATLVVVVVIMGGTAYYLFSQIDSVETPPLVPVPATKPFYPGITSSQNLNRETLKNMEWPTDPSASSGRVLLKDGSADFVADPKTGTVGSLVLNQESVAIGDLDGDGSLDAVAETRANFGGSGWFPTVYLIFNRGGRLAVYPTSVKLGDRERVLASRLLTGFVGLSVQLHGPGESGAVATKREEWSYGLVGNDLVLQGG